MNKVVLYVPDPYAHCAIVSSRCIVEIPLRIIASSYSHIALLALYSSTYLYQYTIKSGWPLLNPFFSFLVASKHNLS